MRRSHHEEERNVQYQGMGRQTQAVCGVCGTILEKDQESNEYRCPVCDSIEE